MENKLNFLSILVAAALLLFASCNGDETPDAENSAPTVANSIANVNLDAGFGTNSINVSNVFTDADNDQLTITASSSNENVVTVAVNGNNLTITEVGAGSATITVTANDGNEGTVSTTFTVTVNATPMNGIPSVANAIADQELSEGFGSIQINIANVFTDPDGDVLTYSATSGDEGVVTVSLNGTILTITEVGIGTSNITIIAEDGNGGSVVENFDVTVSSTTGAATITFGSNGGTSIDINSWSPLTSVDGYVLVISDNSDIADRTNGEEPLFSTTYVGTGEQVIYKGTSIETLEITLLQDQTTYYFKVFPYIGNFVFDNSREEQESMTTSCSTTSTTESEVCFEINGDLRIISSNQLADHPTGNFPNADPTAIQVTRELDLTPALTGNIIYVFDETGPPTPSNDNFWQFGIATNGVEFHPMGLKPWTNPDDGEENWAWQAKVAFEGETDVDQYGAHVTSQGNYHYHGDITGLADEDGSRHSLLYGFAGDGFPIYYKFGYTISDDPSSAIKELKSSYKLKSGSRTGTGTAGKDYPDGTHDGTYIQDYEYEEGLGDLDECNGRSGITPEFPDGTYYYVITTDFPVTPNCFKGTPDDDWKIGK